MGVSVEDRNLRKIEEMWGLKVTLKLPFYTLKEKDIKEMGSSCKN